MTKPPFPEATATLTDAEVVAYLTELAGRGYLVRSHPGSTTTYFVVLPDGRRPTIEKVGGQWLLAGAPNTRKFAKPVWDVADLRARFGFEPDVRPTSIRTQRDAPASNIVRIAGIISGRCLTAVFDPYLDDRGLANLMSLVNIGASWSSPLRLLTGAKARARITEAFFRNFYSERRLTGEVRVMTHNEHRRFVLLDDARSMIVGFSWNQPAHAEVVTLEPDTADRAFFDAEWATATVFIQV